MRTFSSINSIKKMVLVLLTSLASTLVYADVGPSPDCSNEIHCTHVQGLSSNSNEGRYIKLTAANMSVSFCLADNYSLIPTPIFVFIHHLKSGVASLTMSICKDASGTDCVNFGTDNFTYNGEANNGIGTSSPQITNLVLPAELMAAMPSCVADSPPYN